MDALAQIPVEIAYHGVHQLLRPRLVQTVVFPQQLLLLLGVDHGHILPGPRGGVVKGVSRHKPGDEEVEQVDGRTGEQEQQNAAGYGGRQRSM